MLWIVGCVAGSAAVAAALWMRPSVLDRGDMQVSREIPSATGSKGAEQPHESPTGDAGRTGPVDTRRPAPAPATVTGLGTIATRGLPARDNGPQPIASFAEPSIDSVRAAPSGRPLVRFAAPASAQALAAKVANNSLAELYFEPADSTTAIRLMCSDGPQGVDIALTTRPMSVDEFRSCGGAAGFARTMGYKVAFVATELGYYGAAVTAAKTAATFRVSPRQLFLALAAEVPGPLDARRLIANPNRNWNQIDPGLESREIAVFGPPRESPAAMAMAELLLEAGCDEWPWIRALRTENPQRHRKICHSVREDGLYTPEQPTDYFVTQTLWSEPSALVILDYNFFDARRDQFAGSMLAGADAKPATIAAATYEAARPLYLYAPELTLRRNNIRRVFYMEYAHAVRDSGYLLVPAASPMQVQFELLTLSFDGRGGRLSREPFKEIDRINNRSDRQ
jgi:phosphate transport system substrate-binding protein